jgi:hypothetical protein
MMRVNGLVWSCGGERGGGKGHGKVSKGESFTPHRAAVISRTPLQDSPHWSSDGVRGDDIPEASVGLKDGVLGDDRR